MYNLYSNFPPVRALSAATSTRFKRYYFGTLKIMAGRVLLSVLTASELDPDLKAIKKHVGIPLIKFTDVKVELGQNSSPFLKENVKIAN